MPIDEFGRQVPSGSGTNTFGDARDRNFPPHRRSRSRSRSRDRDYPRDHPREHPRDHHDRDAGTNGAIDPFDPRRLDHGRPRSRSPGRGRRGNSRGSGGRISPSPEGRRDRDKDGHYGDRDRRRGRPRGDSDFEFKDRNFDRDRGGRNRGEYGHGRHRGGRARSRSYDEADDYRHTSAGDGRGSSQGRSKVHPSVRYIEHPMLCQFLWKKELEEEAKLQAAGAPDTEPAADGTTEEQDKDMSDVTSNENGASGGAQVVPPEEEDLRNTLEPIFESAEAAEEAYTDYSIKYCLNYVRTFFNQHLDDPWFRQRLSPLEAVRRAKKERARANDEASEFRKEILQSLEESQSGVIPKKDPDCPDYLGPPKCSFVSGCRLGVGTKPTPSTASSSLYRPRNFDDDRDNYDEENHHDSHTIVLQGDDRNRIERHAKHHLHSFVKTDACVKISKVPPHASDEQILVSLAEHCRAKPPLAVWSSDVSIPTNASNADDPYHRTVFAVFPSTAAKENMFENLFRANEEAKRHRRDNGKDLPQYLDLDVDCTDVYGRREVDADGKGGAPPSAKANEDGQGEAPKKGGAVTKLPVRRCTVSVSTQPLSKSQPVSVLSAAVSSRERIGRDKEDIGMISRTLDEARDIKMGNRLDDLLRLLYPGSELLAVDDEDILDVSIAYLRRVHLLSFYNGSSWASDVGNVLAGLHPAGTIHLRLRNADEILRKSSEENKGNDANAEGDGMFEEKEGENEGGNAVAKDLLVMRLNDSIAKTLENVKLLAERGPGCFVDEDTDTAAKEIEALEQHTKQEWIENHGLVDGDGRARCSFHFCRKLFKDKAYLQKHLLKKHPDQLRAECAKCHDEPMMAAWDQDENRPVPHVLIECGSKFGLVSSAVSGAERPIAIDPEPELWRKEEERMAEEDRKEKERMAAAEAAAKADQEERQRRQEEMANAGEKRRGNFVDVDDMVDEKVELSFENVEVAPPPKKKKKKKKLL